MHFLRQSHARYSAIGLSQAASVRSPIIAFSSPPFFAKSGCLQLQLKLLMKKHALILIANMHLHVIANMH